MPIVTQQYPSIMHPNSDMMIMNNMNTLMHLNTTSTQANIQQSGILLNANTHLISPIANQQTHTHTHTQCFLCAPGWVWFIRTYPIITSGSDIDTFGHSQRNNCIHERTMNEVHNNRFQ